MKNLLEVELQDKSSSPVPHQVEFDSDICAVKIENENPVTEVRLNGQKLNDIHDLTKKVDKMTTVIRTLALTATFLAVVAVAGISAVGYWIATHHEKITLTMEDTKKLNSFKFSTVYRSNLAVRQKLKSLGWVWKDGWQQISINEISPVNSIPIRRVKRN